MKYFKIVLNWILRIINNLIPKDKKSILLFPNEGGAIDHYNITNWHSDNVLSLAHSLLTDSKYNDYHLYIVYFRDEELEECKQYCMQFTPPRVHFIKFAYSIEYFKAYSKCYNIFVANYYRITGYKSKKQRVICLGYFTAPFKGNYLNFEKMTRREYNKISKRRNDYIDYHVSTSDLCSREIVVSSLINLPKFLSLGFPRDDVFYSHEDYKKKLYDAIGFIPKTIICYTPTHRDYENEHRSQYEASQCKKRTIFGNTDIEREKSLLQLLEETNSIIIVKAHYAQERGVLLDDSSKRIILYSELIKKVKTNLHEIMCASDILINDYSSAFYDYLCLNRPIIFYQYDHDYYQQKRGLWLNPMTPLLVGPFATNFDELVESIRITMDGDDNYKEKRQYLRDFIDANQDGKSSERIISYFVND